MLEGFLVDHGHLNSVTPGEWHADAPVASFWTGTKTTGRQRRRIVRAAQYWLAGHPDFGGHDIAFDVVLAAPFAWPRYMANAFPM